MPKRLAFIVVLFSALAGAQTNQPILQPHQTFVNGAGSPCSACLLYTYAAGTTTPLATYSSNGGSANQNPVILDAAGGANIWLGASSYKFVLTDALGGTIWTVDNVAGLLGTGVFLPLTGGTLSGGLSGTTATFSGQVSGGSGVFPVVNSIYYPANFSSLQADVTACGSNLCTFWITTQITGISTYSIPANIGIYVGPAGGFQVASAQTLTINNVASAPRSQIFSGPGNVVLGPLNTTVPVQWYGAVADSNATGSTGTDNTASIQSCLNNISAGATCFFSAGNYKITSALLINRSQINIRGVSSPVTSPSAWASPSPSRIVTTSTTADVLDVWGTSTSNSVVDNYIQDITLSRGAIPSAGGQPPSNCSGISEKFTYESVVENVSIEDSANGIYFHGVGASAKGHFSNIDVVWGLNGSVETAGTLVGYYVDSLDGTFSPSLRLRNLDAQAPGIPTTHPGLELVGISSEGKQLSDLHVYHFEGFLIDYGIVIHGIGMTGFAQATDIFLENCILDNMLTTGLLVEGIAGYGTVNLTDGWIYMNGASVHPAIDMEASSNVIISNEKIYSPNLAAPVVYALQGGNQQIIGNQFIGGPAGAITLDNSPTSVISSNVISGVNNYGTDVIKLVNGSSFSTVTGNTINGTATNGITIDVATTGTQGLETNSIGFPSFGTITNKFNVSAGNFLGIANGMRIGVNPTTITGAQGTDVNLLTSGTISGAAGSSLCTDANGGATTTGCSGGGGGTTITSFTFSTNTTSVAAGTCTAQTGVTITGAATTSTITQPVPTTTLSGVSGWGSGGTLRIQVEPPTANTFNYDICNDDPGAAHAPGGAVTWRAAWF